MTIDYSTLEIQLEVAMAFMHKFGGGYIWFVYGGGMGELTSIIYSLSPNKGCYFFDTWTVTRAYNVSSGVIYSDIRKAKAAFAEYAKAFKLIRYTSKELIAVRKKIRQVVMNRCYIAKLWTGAEYRIDGLYKAPYNNVLQLLNRRLPDGTFVQDAQVPLCTPEVDTEKGIAAIGVVCTVGTERRVQYYDDN